MLLWSMNLAWNSNDTSMSSHTQKKRKKNLTIYKQLLQNQEALGSSTVEHMLSHKRHGIQVVHSQPPGVRFLHNLSLFTAPLFLSRKPDPLSQRRKDCVHTWSRIQFTRLFPFSRKWVWLARLVSILGSLAISLLCLQSSISYLWLLTLCILTLDRPTRTVVPERQQTDQSTRCVRAC